MVSKNAIAISFHYLLYKKYRVKMTVYSKVSKSFWYLLLSLIDISLLSSCDWEGVGSICCLGCFGFARNRPMSFLWTAFAAIYCWDLVAISLDGFDSNIIVSIGSNSLWAALVAIFLVRFGSNFPGRLFTAIFLGRLDSNFYFWLALAAIYFGELRQQLSLGSSCSNIFGEIRQQFLWAAVATISDVTIIYLM